MKDGVCVWRVEKPQFNNFVLILYLHRDLKPENILIDSEVSKVIPTFVLMILILSDNCQYSSLGSYCFDGFWSL